MAKQTLPTNYLDDILNAAMNGKRRYIITQNDDGTYSLEDATVYDQIGSVLGQAVLNAICGAVNESADQAKIIDVLSSVAAVTESGYIMGAKAGAELYKNLTTTITNLAKVKTYVGTDGKLHFINSAGADTALNFSKGIHKIISATTYVRFYGYNAEIYTKIIFDISDCKSMKTSSVQNAWFQHKYALSVTTDFGTETSLVENTTYDLSSYNYLQITFHHPYANNDGISTVTLGEIQFE